MKEVDEALSRAYSWRRPAGASGVPAPHWPPGHDPARPAAGSLAGRFDAAADTASHGDRLQWPELISALERRWGERFEQLADRLIQARDRQRLKVLLFTSCHRAEGRTSLVLTLARSLARRAGRTLLVDADLTGPMLSRSLGLRPEVGLDDVIEGGQAASDALIEAPADNLWVLPLRAPVARPRDFLASPGWSCLMARLRREFDLVLIDGSPMFTGLSAAVLHRSVDAAVLVHGRNMTGERSLLRAREVLHGAGIPLLGLAETFV
jgi:Mrp family chromosome partitioning ATPase